MWARFSGSLSALAIENVFSSCVPERPNHAQHGSTESMLLQPTRNRNSITCCPTAELSGPACPACPACPERSLGERSLGELVAGLLPVHFSLFTRSNGNMRPAANSNSCCSRSQAISMMVLRLTTSASLYLSSLGRASGLPRRCSCQSTTAS